MKINKIYLAVLAAALILAGCNNMAKNREQANLRWNSARSTISLSQATEQLDNGNIDDAYVSVVKALELEPDNYNAQVLYARILIAKRKYTNAFELLKKLAQENSADAQIPFLTAIAFEQKGDLERALQNYRNACVRDADNPVYLFAQVECLAALGRTKMAFALAEDELVPVAESFSAYQIAGDLSMTLEKYEPAIKYYSQAVCSQPDSAQTRKALADAYFFAGQYIEAANILESLVKIQPYNMSAWTHCMLGDCYMAIGQPAEATGAYEMACELDDENVAMLVNLAKSSLASNDLPRAILSSRRALRRDSDNISATMVMAYSLMRQGKNAQAIDRLLASHNANPDDATLMCLLGQAYQAEGYLGKARSFYTQALKVDSNSALASSLLSAMANK